MSRRLLVLIGVLSCSFAACGETSVGDPCEKCTAPEHGTATCIDSVCGFECVDGYHAEGTACVPNETTRCCGDACVDCTTIKNARDVSCEEGVCAVSSCESGYHKQGASCVADSEKSCGESAVDCTAIANADEVACEGGACKVVTCKDGYHLKQNVCVADSVTECGASGVDCTDPDRHVAAGGAACVDGKCVISACADGYHLDGGLCLADTAAACGADKTNCANKPHVDPEMVECIDGACAIHGCAADYHLAGNECIADSTAACGETADKCTDYPYVAADGVSCVDGQCIIDLCVAGRHVEGNACVLDSIRGCGPLGLDCTVAPQLKDNSTEMACQSARCVATSCVANHHLSDGDCNADVANECGPTLANCNVSPNKKPGSDTMACVAAECVAETCLPDFHKQGKGCESDSALACGDLAVNCASVTIANVETKACVGGQCVAATCLVGFHVVAGACVADTLAACGATPVDCATVHVANASAKTCVDGQCKAESCIVGFHLVNNVCVEDTLTACGGVGSEHNCETKTMPGAETRKCEAGICKAGSCIANYHFDTAGTGCAADTLVACGAPGVNCNTTKPANADAMKCESAQCRIDTCLAGYHRSATGAACEADSATACGPSAVNCNNAMPGNYASEMECVAAACKIKTCAVNAHPNGSLCDPDSTTACGSASLNCNDSMPANNARLMKCEAAQCKIAACADSYHFLGEVCAPDTSTACGADLTNCDSAMPANHASKMKCQAGLCKIETCLPNYELNGEVCDEQNPNACGTPAVNCYDSKPVNAADMKCVAGSCRVATCVADFHPSSNAMACNPDSVTACGSATNSCNAAMPANHATAMACESAQCKVVTCANDYHASTDRTLCEADVTTACGPSAVNCDLAMPGNNADAMKCEAAQCKIATCVDDFHLTALGAECEGDTLAACGSHDNDCSVGKPAGADVMACVAGACKISTCLADYHLNSTVCDADSATACGSVANDCTASKPEFADVMKCEAAQCKIQSCVVNYHPSASAAVCEVDSDSACGSVSTNCATAMPVGAATSKCEGGACIALSCNVGHHLVSKACVEDTPEACGTTPKNCTNVLNTLPNSTQMGCSAGVCVALACKAGYAVEYGVCSQLCEAGTKNCITSITNATRTICSTTDDTCMVTNCAVGFRPKDDGTACVADTLDNCGAIGRDCSLYAGEPLCTAGKCQSEVCKPGFLMGPNGCEKIAEIFSGSQVNATYCALLERSRGIQCWGANNGNLGNGGITNPAAAAAPVKGCVTGMNMAALHTTHACFLREDGTVLCSGSPNNGVLGNGTTSGAIYAPAPVLQEYDGTANPRISVPHAWRATYITVGSAFSCALTAQGKVKCWGSSNRICAGSSGNQPLPVDVPIPGGRVKKLASGNEFTCALNELNEVWCWGNNANYQLGSASAPNPALAPVKALLPAGDVVELVAANTRACAVYSDGSMACWGANSAYQAGVDPTVANVVPTKASYINTVGRLSLGDQHGCFVVGGAVFCFGTNNADTQFGVSSAVQGNTALPIGMPFLTSGVRAVVSGVKSNCALKSDGSVYCWGSNANGALGAGLSTSTPVPIMAEPQPIISDVSFARPCDASGCAPFCNAGYRLVNGICAPMNSTTCCGTSCHDCTQAASNGYSSCDTVAGACKLDSCVQGFHVSAGACVADSDTACGEPPVSCDAMENAPVTTASCVMAFCKVTACAEGYYPKADGTGCDQEATAACGPLQVDCTDANATSVSCVSGACKVAGCKDKFHKNADESRCVADSVAACGNETTSCVSGMEAGLCVSGSCDMTPATKTCAPGFLRSDLGCERVASITGYGDSYCAILSPSRALKCWGQHLNGRLGTGQDYKNTVVERPTLVADYGVKKVAIGLSNGCLVTDEGMVQCWGSDANGQLGRGTTSTSPETRPVSLANQDWKAIDIAISSYFVCALTKVGSVICWGSDSELFASATPGYGQRIMTGMEEKVTAISAGSKFLCAAFEDGAVKCVGDNTEAAVGLWKRAIPGDESSALVRENTKITTLTKPTYDGAFAEGLELISGVAQTCAVNSRSDIVCWGNNGNGQLGLGPSRLYVWPSKFVAMPFASAIAFGLNHGCGIETDAEGAPGVVKCWGLNSYYALGSDIPGSVAGAQVTGLGIGAVDVAVGTRNSCAVASDGAIWCWGNNIYGALGVGSTATALNAPVPGKVLGDGDTYNETPAYHGKHSECNTGFKASPTGTACLAENSVACCGASCANCLDLVNAHRATCDTTGGEPVCKPVACAPNFHLKDGACVADTQTECGNDTQNCNFAVPPNGTAAKCQGGVCAATTCIPNYHVSGIGCAENSDTACGSPTNDCTDDVIDHATAIHCVNAACAATACEADYHVANKVCAADTSDACGPTAVNCNTALLGSASTQCVSAQCVATSCSLGYHLGIDVCVLDDGSACGVAQTDCYETSAPGVTEFGCSAGLCVISECEVGKHPSRTGVECENDRLAACGSFGVDCNLYKSDAQNPVACTSGLCQSEQCEDGYLMGINGCEKVAQIFGGVGGGQWCALSQTSRGIQCWGNDGNGQLGRGSTSANRGNPAPVLGASQGMKKAALHFSHSCFLSDEGSITCTGSRTAGELGDGSTVTSGAISTPVAVVDGPNSLVPHRWRATDVVVGQGFSCALTSYGKVKCWGQLSLTGTGINSASAQPAPMDVYVGPSDAKVKQIASALNYTCALTENDEVWCWGQNGSMYSLGMTGINTTAYAYSPVKINLPVSGAIGQLRASGARACVVMATGALYCWGQNTYGQSAFDPGQANGIMPAKASYIDSIGEVLLASDHACTVENGAVRCFGRNTSNAEFGFASSTGPQYALVTAPYASFGIASVAPGHNGTCAVRTNGMGVCWGSNSNGALGTGSTSSFVSVAPVAIVSETTTAPCGAAGCAPLCGPGYRPENDACVALDSPLCCGTGCADCTDAYANANSRCDSVELTCKLDSCRAGFVFDGASCVAESSSACGSTKTNCTLLVGTENIESVDCVAGKCAITACVPGHHPVAAQNSCAADANGACGFAATNCANAFANGLSTCVAGACQLDSCKAGYHLSGDGSRCNIDDVYACGSDSVSCVDSATLQTAKCVSGSCETAKSACAPGYMMGPTKCEKISSLAGFEDTYCVILEESHALKCWGYNGTYARLGQANGDSYKATAQTVADYGVQKVAIGSRNGCYISEEGLVICWGDAGSRVILGKTSGRQFPTSYPAQNWKAVDIALSQTLACALTSTGEILCWGNLADLNRSSENYAVPTQLFSTDGRAFAIAGATDHICAAFDSGLVKCIGNNTTGSLGQFNPDGTVVAGKFFDPQTVPMPSGFGSVAKLFAGKESVCAVDTVGVAACWGKNDVGQAGQAPAQQNAPPALVTSVPFVKSMAIGSQHTCAIEASVEGAALGVKCWGTTDKGQRGYVGPYGHAGTAIEGFTSGVVAVAAGSANSCALDAQGSVRCWGTNTSAALGLDPAEDGVLATAIIATPVAPRLDSLTYKGTADYQPYTKCDPVNPAAEPPVPSNGMIAAPPPRTACRVKNTVVCCGNACGNCLDLPNMATAGCDITGDAGNEVCKALTCDPDSHLVDGACIAFAVDKCGVDELDCNEAPNRAENSASMLCTQGICTAGTCLAGFHKAGGACVADAPNACGEPPVDCGEELIGSSTTECVASQCKATACGFGYYKVGDECLPEETGYCGAGQNCAAQSIEHMSSMACSGGSCVIANCLSGFHPDSTGGACVADSNEACGRNAVDCNLYKSDWYSPVACANSMCQSDECKDGYLMGIYGCERIAKIFSGHVGSPQWCALLERSRGIHCWGNDTEGQFGIGSKMVERFSPTPVIGAAQGMKKAAIHTSHVCYLSEAGGITCAGRETYGQLGNGANDNVRAFTSPIPVLDGAGSTEPHKWRAVDVVVGNGYSCALTDYGRVKCWGSSEFTGTGEAATVNHLVPKDVPVGSPNVPVTMLAGSVAFACAVNANNEVYCWGRNDGTYDAIGIPGVAQSAVVRTPRRLEALVGIGTIVDLQIANYRSCVRTASNALYCWGINSGSQAASVALFSSVQPRRSEYIGSIDNMVLGNAHACSVVGGGVQCWGSNSASNAEFGIETAFNTPSLTVVPTATSNVAAVVPGLYGTCIIRTDGSAYCWGQNTNGALGSGKASGILGKDPRPRAIVGGAGAPRACEVGGCAPYCSPGYRVSSAGLCEPIDALTCCGVACEDCSEFSTVGHAVCDSGTLTCKVASCRPDHYLVDGVCVKESVASCGAGKTACTVPSSEENHIASVACVFGQCAITACDANHHPNAAQTGCLPDDVNACGFASVTCGAPNAKTMACVAGTCQITTCNDGTHLSAGGDACEADTVMACGGASTSCTGVLTQPDAPNQTSACVSGLCDGGTNYDKVTCAPGFLMGPAECEEIESLAGSVDGYCAVLAKSHAVKCWGSNNNTRTGIVGGTTVLSPTTLFDYGIKKVVIGESNGCAISEEGLVACWGSGYTGRTWAIEGVTKDKVTGPVWMPNQNWKAVDIAIGGYMLCALDNHGLVRCWGGDNDMTGSPNTVYAVPTTEIFGTEKAVALAGGYQHLCVAFEGGEVRCAGQNGSGQSGVFKADGQADAAKVATPTAVQMPDGFGTTAKLFAGRYYTCAVDEAQVAVCWGKNNYVQLGSGLPTPSRKPDFVASVGAVQKIVLGETHACAIEADETGLSTGIRCWGKTDKWQAGPSAPLGSTVGVPIIGFGSGTRALATGTNSTCAVNSEGAVRCWGTNSGNGFGLGVDSLAATQPIPGPMKLESLTFSGTAGYRPYDKCDPYNPEAEPPVASNGLVPAPAPRTACVKKDTIGCCGTACGNCLDLASAATVECSGLGAAGVCKALTCAAGHHVDGVTNLCVEDAPVEP